jgi:hypothetical protein
MKLLLISSFLILLFCNCVSNTEPKKYTKFAPPLPTTLDSLQGTWKCLRDTTVTVIINGRIFTEITVDSGFIDSQIYKMYFSDVAIDEYHQHTFDEISIDTSKLSGKYLVNVSLKDSSIECYKFGNIGFSATDTIFSMSDIWAKRNNVNFKKIR